MRSMESVRNKRSNERAKSGTKNNNCLVLKGLRTNRREPFREAGGKILHSREK